MRKLIVNYTWVGSDPATFYLSIQVRLRKLDEDIERILATNDDESHQIDIGDEIVFTRFQRYVAEGRIDYKKVRICVPIAIDQIDRQYLQIDKDGYVLGTDPYDEALGAERGALDEVRERRRIEALHTDETRRLIFVFVRLNVHMLVGLNVHKAYILQNENIIGEMWSDNVRDIDYALDILNNPRHHPGGIVCVFRQGKEGIILKVGIVRFSVYPEDGFEGNLVQVLEDWFS